MTSEGYDIRPAKIRHFSFWSIAAIWFGAGISIAEFWAGALLTPWVSLAVAISLILIGHFIGNAIMGAIAVEGEETGVPTMVLSRGALGTKGSILPSVLNYLQLIGWTAIMLVVGAQAMEQVSEAFGFRAYYLWVAILGALVTFWTYIGPEKWDKVEKAASGLLLALSLWILYVTLTKFPLHALLSRPGKGGLPPMEGLDLVIAMPLSWAPLIADYSRFCRSKGGSFWGTFLGYLASSGLFYFIGALTNEAIGKQDPIAIIASMGLGIPAMLIIVFSTVTTTFMDVYSAAITYKNIVPKGNAKKQVILVGILGTILAAFFPISKYQSFLLVIGGAFVSLAAVMIVDYFVLKRGYDPEGLLEGKYGKYNWKGLISWAIGFLFYALTASYGLFGIKIPGFSWIGDNFGSTIPTFALVSAIYYALGRWSK